MTPAIRSASTCPLHGCGWRRGTRRQSGGRSPPKLPPPGPEQSETHDGSSVAPCESGEDFIGLLRGKLAVVDHHQVAEVHCFPGRQRIAAVLALVLGKGPESEGIC